MEQCHPVLELTICYGHKPLLFFVKVSLYQKNVFCFPSTFFVDPFPHCAVTMNDLNSGILYNHLKNMDDSSSIAEEPLLLLTLFSIADELFTFMLSNDDGEFVIGERIKEPEEKIFEPLFASMPCNRKWNNDFSRHSSMAKELKNQSGTKLVRPCKKVKHVMEKDQQMTKVLEHWSSRNNKKSGKKHLNFQLG